MRKEETLMADNLFVEVEAEIKRQTEKAYLIDHGGDEEVWLPKSQVSHSAPDSERSNLRVFLVPEWLAIDKGLV